MAKKIKATAIGNMKPSVGNAKPSVGNVQPAPQLGQGILSAPTAAAAPKQAAPGIEKPKRAVFAKAKQVMKPKKPKMPGMQ
jgi:hypothetical protein